MRHATQRFQLVLAAVVAPARRRCPFSRSPDSRRSGCGSRQRPRSGGCRSTRRSTWRSSRTSASRSSGSTRRSRTSPSRRRAASGCRRSSTSLSNNSTSNPPTNAFAGGQNKVTDSRFATQFGVNQLLPTGAQLQRSLEQLPRHLDQHLQQLRSAAASRRCTFNVTQPLLRNFKIDNIRQQLAVEPEGSRQRRTSSCSRRSSSTTRNVKNAYWDLAYQIDNLNAAQQSLDLAQAPARRQREARPDRHDGADRHRRGAVGSRAQRGVGDRRRGGDQAGGGRPAGADLRSGVAGLLDDDDRADRDAAVPGAGDRRRGGRAARARQPARCPSREEQPRAQRHQHPLLPEPDAARRQRAGRRTASTAVGGVQLEPVDLAQRAGAVSARRSSRSAASARCSATSSATPSRRGRSASPLSYPARHEHVGSEPGARAAAALARRRRSCRNLELQIATQVRDLARQVQTNQKRVDTHPRRARARRAAARGRGEEVRRRHRDQLLRLPGAARPRRRRAPTRSAPSPTTTSRSWTSRPSRKRRCRLTQRGQSGTGRPGALTQVLLRPADSDCAVPGRPTSPPQPSLHSPRAEALGHGHHQERSGEPRRGARVGGVGRRDRRRRLREHRRHGGHRAAVHRSRRRPRAWPGYVAQKNYAASLARHDWILSLDADERVTPELAAEIQRALSADARARGVPHSARDLAPRPLDPHDRLVSRPSAAPVRSPRRRAGPGRYVHESVAVDGTRRPAGAASCSTSRIATSPIISRRSIATRRSPRGRCARAGGAPACCRWPVIRRSPSCATTSLRGGFRDGAPGFIISALNAYYVFLKFAKLWELQTGPARPRSHEATRHAGNRSSHVLPPHRHGANLARRPEPGAADRQRPARDRASRGARRASRRRAAAARRGRARAHPDRAADRDGPVGRLAAGARRQAARGRTSFTRTIRTASRWRRWRCRSASAKARPAPALVASRRVDFHLKGNSFSRWKHRQVDCFIAASEAIRQMLAGRRRAGRSDGHGARGHRRRSRCRPRRP